MSIIAIATASSTEILNLDEFVSPETINRAVLQLILSMDDQLYPQQMSQETITGTSLQSGSTSGNVKDWHKIVQHQLVLIFHAHKCLQQDQQANGDIQICSLVQCNPTKNTLIHMTTCKSGKDCTLPNCDSFRSIITHWKTCLNNDCPVCSPLRQIAKNKVADLPEGAQSHQPEVKSGINQRAYSQGPQNISNVSFSASSTTKNQAININQSSSVTESVATDNLQQQSLNPNETDAININQAAYSQVDIGLVQGPEECHKLVAADIREGNVNKLVQAMFPVADPESILDTRLNNLLNYAKHIEADIYDQANSIFEYNHLVANKIIETRKEFEERFQKRDTQTPDQSIVNYGQLFNATNPFISNSQTVAVGSNQATSVEGSNYIAAAAMSAIPQESNEIMDQLFGFNDFNQSTTLNGNRLPNFQLPDGLTPEQVSATPVEETKEWQRVMTLDIRNYLVRKLFNVIFANRNPVTFFNRLNNLVCYVKKLELDLYEMANSRLEYYNLLGEKIYKIQKEMNEKRQNRTEMQLAQQQQHSQSQIAGSSGYQTFSTLQNFSQAAGPSSSVNYPAGINQFHNTQGSMPQVFGF